MADNIVEITFTNVAFVPVDGHTLSISGSTNVDYTAGNVIAGPLTATLDGNPEILFRVIASSTVGRTSIRA
jgi:hypothetical protein